MLLRPEEPHQHIIEEGLAAGADRLQERDGEQPQRHVEERALQQQRPDRRAGSLALLGLGGRAGGVGGDRRRPLGDVALHGWFLDCWCGTLANDAGSYTAAGLL
jgi:hypothetical protein